MKVDYLIYNKEKINSVFCREKNLQKNEREQAAKIQRNRLNSNQNIFLLNRNTRGNIVYSIFVSIL